MLEDLTGRGISPASYEMGTAMEKIIGTKANEFGEKRLYEDTDYAGRKFWRGVKETETGWYDYEFDDEERAMGWLNC